MATTLNCPNILSRGSYRHRLSKVTVIHNSPVSLSKVSIPIGRAFRRLRWNNITNSLDRLIHRFNIRISIHNRFRNPFLSIKGRLSTSLQGNLHKRAVNPLHVLNLKFLSSRFNPPRLLPRICPQEP
jgi:hypothetical protein